MKPKTLMAALLSSSVVTLTAVAQDASWVPVWGDEFDGPDIDTRNWTFDIGGNGWGNNELQYYTDRPVNSRIVPIDPEEGEGFNGALMIEAHEEKYRNRRYTSARLKTQGLRNFTYGRIEARIQLPQSTGAWPAFWMLGSDFVDVGWPNCGEIDIMEWVPSLELSTRGSAHGPEYFGAHSFHGDWGGPLTEGFHVFAVEWEPESIRWLVDGEEFVEMTRETVPGTWVFDHPFFIILNLAIGGDWPGPPDETTEFPLRMLVDYVRVVQHETPPPSELSLMFVEKISMETLSRGPNWEAVATVHVSDEIGPLAGVEVLGSWSGLIDVGMTERTTDEYGVAVLHSGKVRSSGVIWFNVVDLVKDGYHYQPPAGGDWGAISN
jgi:beta-glucanase (GH16 family)